MVSLYFIKQSLSIKEKEFMKANLHSFAVRRIERSNKERFLFLDSLRGMTVLHMVLYHAIWDMRNLFHFQIFMESKTELYIYQQCICWTFILLSGFCSRLGHHHLRRGLLVLVCGILVSIVTILVMPDRCIIFGILTFLGIAMLSIIPLEPVLKNIPPVIGVICALLLFLLTRNLSRGSLGFEWITLLELPNWLYQGYIASFFGFKSDSFHFSDYFPLFPWFFLFLTGYFLCCHFYDRLHVMRLMKFHAAPLDFIGRHSLLFYMLHQPIIYVVLYICF